MPKDVLHPISPRIRGAFLKALKEKSRRDGKTFSQLMLDEIDEHGLLLVMEKVGKFAERSHTHRVRGEVDHKHTHERLPETTEFIEGVLSGGTFASPEEPSEERPLLPH